MVNWYKAWGSQSIFRASRTRVLQLLSQHDQQEREQPELTVAANTLKLEVAKNNYDMKYSFDTKSNAEW